LTIPPERGDESRQGYQVIFVRSYWFGVLILIGLLVTCSSAGAQQPKKIPHIGFVSPVDVPHYFLAFRQGLRELGYTEGQNLFIEFRSANGVPNRLPELVADLVRAKVDLIVAASGGAAVAAKDGTNAIPIVFGMTGDPVAMGLVKGLARPGGNVTGLSTLITETSGKRLQLLKEITNASRVGILSSSSSSETGASLKDLQPTARSLHVELSVVDVRDENGLDSAFSALRNEHVGALIVLTGALLTQHRNQIVQLAANSRLPAMYGISEFMDVGGLMFYGANLMEVYRRAAIYADKILKGAKPADVPVEQATKFELVINLKTAKQIGLTIPPNVLARADRVIKQGGT